MKVAIVYDRVNKFGGAERVLLSLHTIWPDAPLFTAVYNPVRASWARVFRVMPSFINHIPTARHHHEWFAWLTPMAFESFSFDGYDVVISVTSAEAKSIITKPDTVHICYCLTPTRYLWSETPRYSSVDIGLPNSISSRVFSFLRPTLRRWDMVERSRPDYYIAISKRVANRIEMYYHRSVEAIIYPPVDIRKFIPKQHTDKNDGYFLVVSRLVGYKRVDLIVDVFNDLGWPLVVIGDGWERTSLMQKAKKNIRFLSKHLTDDELVDYYQNCRAFVFAGEEDFGLVAVEAQACGKPVIAYKESGIEEIIRDEKTGILFREQTKASLIDALKRHENGWYDRRLCQKNAERFSEAKFQKEMVQTVQRLVHTL
jgi:glycosyltransferase involved in cell wall biosynthesis